MNLMKLLVFAHSLSILWIACVATVVIGRSRRGLLLLAAALLQAVLNKDQKGRKNANHSCCFLIKHMFYCFFINLLALRINITALAEFFRSGLIASPQVASPVTEDRTLPGCESLTHGVLDALLEYFRSGFFMQIFWENGLPCHMTRPVCGWVGHSAPKYPRVRIQEECHNCSHGRNKFEKNSWAPNREFFNANLGTRKNMRSDQINHLGDLGVCSRRLEPSQLSLGTAFALFVLGSSFLTEVALGMIASVSEVVAIPGVIGTIQRPLKSSCIDERRCFKARCVEAIACLLMFRMYLPHSDTTQLQVGSAEICREVIRAAPRKMQTGLFNVRFIDSFPRSCQELLPAV